MSANNNSKLGRRLRFSELAETPALIAHMLESHTKEGFCVLLYSRVDEQTHFDCKFDSVWDFIGYYSAHLKGLERDMWSFFKDPVYRVVVSDSHKLPLRKKA